MADVFAAHHYTKLPEEAAAVTIQAGMDIDCGDFIPKHGESALEKGILKESQVNKALHNLFTVRMKLGHFDPPGPLQKIPPSVICSPEAIELARESAREAAVLLKNSDHFLPLLPDRFRRVLVVGPNVDLCKRMALYYGASACFNRYPTIADAFKEYNKYVTVVKGLRFPASRSLQNTTLIEQALKTADLVVFALGTDSSLEQEGRDRVEIGLPQGQQKLVSFVLDKLPTKAQAMAVMFSGGPIDITPLLAAERVKAVVHAGQPTVAVQGVGDVIFGLKSPAGRLVQTLYPEDYVHQVSLFETGLRPGKSQWPPFTTPGRTYRFYTGKTVLPFGYGLSYTTFKYSSVETPHISLSNVKNALAEDPDGIVSKCSITVTNTGNMDSDHVVLGFLSGPLAGKAGRPQKSLVDFKRVHIPRGKTVQVELNLKASDFAFAQTDGSVATEAGVYTVELGLKETEDSMGYIAKEFKVLESRSTAEY